MNEARKFFLNFHSLRRKDYVNLPKFQNYFSKIFKETKMLLQDELTESQKKEKLENMIQSLKQAQIEIRNFKENEEFIPKPADSEENDTIDLNNYNYPQKVKSKRFRALRRQTTLRQKNGSFVGERKIRFSKVGEASIKRNNTSILKKYRKTILKTPSNFSSLVPSPSPRSPTSFTRNNDSFKIRPFFNNGNLRKNETMLSKKIIFYGFRTEY